MIADARRKAQTVLDTHASAYGGVTRVQWDRVWLDGFARDVLAALDSDSPSLADFDARTAALLVLAGRELDRARKRFPPYNSAHEGWAVIHEESCELWEHVRGDTGTGEAALREAIQLAAVALRYAYDVSAVSAVSAVVE